MLLILSSGDVAVHHIHSQHMQALTVPPAGLPVPILHQIIIVSSDVYRRDMSNDRSDMRVHDRVKNDV